MNSIQLANKVWDEVKSYENLRDYHIDSAIKEYGWGRPQFVRQNAFRNCKKFSKI